MTTQKAPEVRIIDATGDIIGDQVAATFARVECSCDDCPNEPEWSRALGDVTEQLLADADTMAEVMLEQLRARITTALSAFAQTHPEATLVGGRYGEA